MKPAPERQEDMETTIKSSAPVDDPLDMVKLANDIAESHARMVRIGMESAEERIQPAINALRREFEAALIDPATKIKSSLQVAILNVLSLTHSR